MHIYLLKGPVDGCLMKYGSILLKCITKCEPRMDKSSISLLELDGIMIAMQGLLSS
jgi:hypothetical protein